MRSYLWPTQILAFHIANKIFINAFVRASKNSAADWRIFVRNFVLFALALQIVSV